MPEPGMGGGPSGPSGGMGGPNDPTGSGFGGTGPTGNPSINDVGWGGYAEAFGNMAAQYNSPAMVARGIKEGLDYAQQFALDRGWQAPELNPGIEGGGGMGGSRSGYGYDPYANPSPNMGMMGSSATSPASSYLNQVYGLHPEADPNAYLFGMQGYYTPRSYADLALESSALPRSGADYYSDTGGNRYLRSYLEASGVPNTGTINPLTGYTPSREEVAIPDWFRPGGQEPGGYKPDYTGALQRFLENPTGQVYQDNPNVQAGIAEYLADNPDVAADPYYGEGTGALHHYLQLGRGEGRAWEAPLPSQITPLRRAHGGMVSDPMMMGYAHGGAPMMDSGMMGGMIPGAGGGREDNIPVVASSGEYVLPAFVSSALGQGNTEAGADMLDRWVEDIKMRYADELTQLPPPSRGM